MKATKAARKFDLTDGNILSKLLLISLPIIGSQFLQMLYNLLDMFWMGRVGSYAVAATGSVGMYLWLSMAFLILGSRGAEIGVSQNIGKGDRESARLIGQSSFSLSCLLGLTVGAAMLLLRRPLIGFFNIQEAQVVDSASSYMAIVALGLPFSFVSAAIVGIYNGSGNSQRPFVINLIAMGINTILDPILIFPCGLGIRGAAIGTVVAQMVACVLHIWTLTRGKDRPFAHFAIFAPPAPGHVKQILKWTTPIAIESFLFTFLSMMISRFVATFGTGAMAAQRIGSQVESLSWLIAGGYSSAVTSFTGQNFGAKKWGRIRKGFRISTAAMLIYGVLITCVLLFGSDTIYRLFLPEDPGVIAIGGRYLRILATCQILACLEAIAAGAFRGMGRTLPPSLVSVCANAARVALAFALMNTSLGLEGIWWAVAIGAAARGLWMYGWHFVATRSSIQEDDEGGGGGLRRPAFLEESGAKNFNQG